MRILLPSIPNKDTFPNTLLSTFWHSLLNPSITWKTGGLCIGVFQNFSIFWGISNTVFRPSFLISLPYLSPRGVQYHLYKSINKGNDRVPSLCPWGSLQETGGKECDVGILIPPDPTLRWAMPPQPKSQILSQVFYTAFPFGVPLSIFSFYFFGPNLVTALMF